MYIWTTLYAFYTVLLLRRFESTAPIPFPPAVMKPNKISKRAYIKFASQTTKQQKEKNK